MFLADVIDKTSQLSVGEGALYSILAIVMVFAILLLIIGVTTLVFKMNGLFDLKKELDEAKAKENQPCCCACNNQVKSLTIDENDEDLMAAILVATIDYQNEIKKDVRVVSVRKVN